MNNWAPKKCRMFLNVFKCLTHIKSIKLYFFDDFCIDVI